MDAGETSVGEFLKVAKVREFREGQGRRVMVDGNAVAIYRRGERFYAFSDDCPHMGASLADGKLVGERVQCHWHAWNFDLATGQSDMREWACVLIHEVRVDGDDVLVKLTEPPPREPEPPPDDDWFVWDPE
jgi:nitrite reductase (NADH) small subunit/3-phenylpropionate/trans-cinnamate dioxygenase ferredoxin subunit